jgi:sulfur-oxidizing protein SoxX
MAILVSGAGLVPYRIDGDRIDTPLTGHPGDPASGRALMLDLHVSTCLLCHAGPFPEQRFQGTIGPSLTGVGDRLDPAQIRLRLVDATSVNPETLMPRFYATTGLTRVAPAYTGRPVFEADQIEDLVAFLTTLKAP